ncbi:UNVERIFIED_CONTAM: growth inhibitor PemK [Euhalothece sp. KZN 001]
MDIERGEVIRVNLNPISGREQSGNARPCLVISHTRYNKARSGIVIVTPITRTVKSEVKIMIPIPDGFQVQGSVIAEQVRSLDLNTRWWKTTGEVLPKPFVDEVVETLNLIIGS